MILTERTALRRERREPHVFLDLNHDGPEMPSFLRRVQQPENGFENQFLVPSSPYLGLIRVYRFHIATFNRRHTFLNIAAT
jgi:hypothetical protein